MIIVKEIKKSERYLNIYIHGFLFVKLGQGNSGGSVFIAYSRRDADKQIAVKVLPYSIEFKSLSNRELGIACEVNSLKEYL